MKREYIIFPILLGFALIVAYVFYLIWQPFFIPISWAAIFGILFFPLNRKLQRTISSQGVSALIMTLLVIVILVVPMTVLAILLVAEVVNTYDLIQEWFRGGVYKQMLSVFDQPFFQNLLRRANEVIDVGSIDLYSIVSSVMQRLSSFAVSQVSDIVQNFSRSLFSFILMIFTLFYLFKDGERIAGFLRSLIPLPPQRREQITSQFTEVITATVLGDLVVAALQGLLGGIAFWILGLPSPVFWGSLMAFLSILPVVGAPIVYLPAAGILLIQNQYVKGIVLLIWGSVVVSQIDNFLRPILISGRTKLHTLVLFFSILGGIYVFGFLGIIMGPVIASLLLAILRIYREDIVSPQQVVQASAVQGSESDQVAE